MKIKSIKIRNFRNIEKIEFLPSGNVNVIYGENAQGKTNIIEAIWALTGNSSFRGAKNSDYIKIGSVGAVIDAVFLDKKREHKEYLSFGEEKRAIVNGIEQKNNSELIGNFYAVVFSPVDLSLIKEGPKNRRSFLDNAICRMNYKYKNYLSVYENLLNQRNALLKDAASYSNIKENIEVWDIQLAKAGTVLSIYRGDYARRLNSAAKLQYEGLSSKKESFFVKYKSTVFDDIDKVLVYDDNSLNRYLDVLKENYETDLKLGYTSAGIHRDDIEVYINDLPAKIYGSQGQQRSSAIALKLAEAELLKKITGENPVMLLDDVMSELDETRQSYILNHLGDMQVFITCCEKELLDKLEKGSFFKIEKGNIIKAEEK